MSEKEAYEEENPAARLYGRLQTAEREQVLLSPNERLRAIHRPLLTWYEEHARQLPWRQDPTPYRVWVSEIMLQQTRVEAVKPYFERFMAAFPDVEALALAKEDRLLKLWEGLGYYSRAKNLKKAAQLLEEKYGGQLPASREALLALPGIGSYTAGAIASIAFGLPVPAVDGNVLRVLSRLLASREDISKPAVKRRTEELLEGAMPRTRVSSFNQGLIEVGALICVPNGKPKCGECPLESLCLASRRGLTEQIPVKAPKKARRVEQRTVCILEWGDFVGIRKRQEGGLLASLYELPNVEGYLNQESLAASFGFCQEQVRSVEPLPAARHIFSHVEWEMQGYRVVLEGGLPSGCLPVKKEEIRTTYALPGAFAMYTKLIN